MHVLVAPETPTWEILELWFELSGNLRDFNCSFVRVNMRHEVCLLHLPHEGDSDYFH